jgi:hypothetical protein
MNEYDFEHGAWPTSNEMPPLGCRPDNLFLQYTIALAFEGSDSLSREGRWFLANVSRLADKAVREYDACRSALDAFLAGGLRAPSPLSAPDARSVESLTQLLRAADHLENCIDATRRATRFLDTAAFRAWTTQENRTMLADLASGVQRIRNSIQHAEERLEKGRIPDGEPVFVALRSEGAYFAGDFLPYADLAALVIVLWEIAAGLIGAAATSD